MTINQGSKKTTSLFSVSFVGLVSIEESLVFRSNFTAAAISQIILSFLSVLLSLNSQGEGGDKQPHYCNHLTTYLVCLWYIHDYLDFQCSSGAQPHFSWIFFSLGTLPISLRILDCYWKVFSVLLFCSQGHISCPFCSFSF